MLYEFSINPNTVDYWRCTKLRLSVEIDQLHTPYGSTVAVWWLIGLKPSRILQITLHLCAKDYSLRYVITVAVDNFVSNKGDRREVNSQCPSVFYNDTFDCAKYSSLRMQAAKDLGQLAHYNVSSNRENFYQAPSLKIGSWEASSGFCQLAFTTSLQAYITRKLPTQNAT